jgi:hypothetical protein
MQELLAKLRDLEAEVRRERGDFSLFALLQREDAYGKWDLVVAALWIGDWNIEDLQYLCDKVTARLTERELLSLAFVTIVSPDDEPVQRLIREYPVSSDEKPVEIRDWDYNGMAIERGYILTARPTAAAATTPNAVAAG